MPIENFDLPDVGEGLTEAEIVAWRVAPGDEVTVNQIIVEIETAKAVVELPSPHAGRVQALLVEPGITVEVGTPIIAVDTGGEVAAPAAPTGTEGAKIGEVAADGRIATLVGFVDTTVGTTRRPRRGRVDDLGFDGDDVPRAPAGTRRPVAAAARIAEQQVAESVVAEPSPTASASAESSTAVIETLTAVAAEPTVTAGAPEGRDRPQAPLDDARPAVPSGEGRLPATSGGDRQPSTLGEDRPLAPKAAPPVRKLAKDLGVDLGSVHAGRADGVISRAEVEAAAAGSAATVVSADPGNRERRIPIKGVRKATAAAMVSSAFTAPHVSVFLTIDITPTMELRDRLRQRPEFRDVKLSPLTFASRAVCLALRRSPDLNSTWDEAAGEIVVKDYVHLGIAAATPRGLVVPNIRDADGLDLLGLAQQLTELTEVARAGRTTPAAMRGGTFTITNIGVLGVDTGTPILNPGESGILALGSVKDAPWVVDGQLAVRKVCQLSLSFDHRVVDGQQGSRFLADVGALLSDPGLALAW